MRSRLATNRFLAVIVLAVASPAPLLAQPKTIDFNRDVRPILSNNCFACHGPDEKERKADLRLDSKQGLLEAVVVPGKPEESELIARVIAAEDDGIMPPRKSGKKLSAREIEILKQWVKEGAAYATHWAYTPPRKPEIPKTKHHISNPIDAFIRYRLEQEGLTPAPEADRYSLIRRVALDLTGLPATVEEVDDFVRDKSPDAYEKMVDRMLAKPAFGEHWARMWLDLARYADSAGYADDPSRVIWKYRDYVIKSFNDNKPFDRFTIEQIAGDLLPNPTDEQLTATAFHRNTMTNNEGGTNDEEFRNVAVVDRVNTTFTVWMGTSIMCCQCHTHKYDPITQKEYFQVFAFFNNTADADKRDESPLLEFWSEEQEAAKAQLRKKIQSLEQKPEWTSRLRAMVTYKHLVEMKPATTVPILRELPPAQRRKTRIQLRGNFMDLADEVSEGVPSVFHPLPKEAPKNRLALAKWLVSPDNPLTARVTANRFWEKIFGVAIVPTSEEFGIQGELPSRPELLDWLAVELMNPENPSPDPLPQGERGLTSPPSRIGKGAGGLGSWDIKRFLKLIVMSATYRQSAKVTPELYERDPENRLLARGPRVRLSAEMVRDQALFVSGLLSDKRHGPSVKPPQPDLGLKAAFGGSIDWKPSTGEDRYRRGLYTEWRRSNPYPSMSTFDAPNRDICTVRRARTNTPLQALVTMNDPVYVEAAQGLARRMMKEGGTSPADRVAFAMRLSLSRPAKAAEVERLVALYEEAKAKFAKEPAKAKDFATQPLGPLPKETDITDAAAWTVVASVILNLDEMFMKR